MSTQALNGLRDFLTGTLSIADMNWLAAELKEFADRKEAHPQKPYTMEELNAMLDMAEADIAAGRGTPHEEVMREWDEEIARMEPQRQAMQTKG